MLDRARKVLDGAEQGDEADEALGGTRTVIQLARTEAPPRAPVAGRAGAPPRSLSPVLGAYRERAGSSMTGGTRRTLEVRSSSKPIRSAS